MCVARCWRAERGSVALSLVGCTFTHSYLLLIVGRTWIQILISKVINSHFSGVFLGGGGIGRRVVVFVVA